MKPQATYQEILLLTTSRFSKKQFCENDIQLGESSPYNSPEQLEKACWNGLLRDMLPDIIKCNSELYLWQIESHETFLRISLGPQFPVIENFYALDPGFFLRCRQMN